MLYGDTVVDSHWHVDFLPARTENGAGRRRNKENSITLNLSGVLAVLVFSPPLLTETMHPNIQPARSRIWLVPVKAMKDDMIIQDGIVFRLAPLYAWTFHEA